MNKNFHRASVARATGKKHAPKDGQKIPVVIIEGTHGFSWNDNGSEFTKPTDEQNEHEEKKRKEKEDKVKDKRWNELNMGPKVLCPPHRK